MSYEDTISIACTTCKNPVLLSLGAIEAELSCIADCSQCGKKYGIEPGKLAHQLALFVALCKQLKKSEEILSSSSIAVTVGPHEIKVPFKLLLSRFRSTLDIDIGGIKTTVSYRTEPLKVASALFNASDNGSEKFPSTM